MPGAAAGTGAQALPQARNVVGTPRPPASRPRLGAPSTTNQAALHPRSSSLATLPQIGRSRNGVEAVADAV